MSIILEFRLLKAQSHWALESTAIIWASEEANTFPLLEKLLAWTAQKNEGELRGEEVKKWIGKTSVGKSICGKTFYIYWNIFWSKVQGTVCS